MNFTTYADWDRSRVKFLIKQFGKDGFFDKTVLDLGCGHANISGALSRLGAKVTAVDAREEHLREAKLKYPQIETMVLDLEKDFPFTNQKFDFVLCLGILCHVSNFQVLLKNAVSVSKNLILETEVIDSDDSNATSLIEEPSKIYDLSYSGNALKLSSSHIEKLLKATGASFHRYDKSELNASGYSYDWRLNNTGNRNILNRRLWIASAPQKMAAPRVVQAESIPRLSFNNSNETAIPLSIPRRTARFIPKKRVALLLSGHLRTFDKTYQSVLTNLTGSLNCDVFIHTWDTLGSISSKHGSDAQVVAEQTFSRLEAIYKYYDPKKLLIEKFDKDVFIDIGKDIDIPEKDKQFIMGNIGYHFAMFYGIQKCNNLRKEYQQSLEFEYDYVIRFRPDILLKTKIDSSFLPENKMTVNVPVIGQYCPEGMNDQIALGSSSVMDVYCNFFDKIKDYCQRRVTTIRPEALLQYHMTANSISVERKDINYELIRVDGSRVLL